METRTSWTIFGCYLEGRDVEPFVDIVDATDPGTAVNIALANNSDLIVLSVHPGAIAPAVPDETWTDVVDDFNQGLED